MSKSTRPTVLALLILTSASLPALSQSGDAKPTSTDLDRPAAAAPTTAVALLRTRVDLVDWEDQPVEDVLEWLQARSSVNIIAVWSALDLEAVTRDDTVTLYLTDATVADVLNEVAAQLSQDDVVTYQGCGNTLRIATRPFFDAKPYLRVYEVTDLLMRRVQNQAQAPTIDLQQTNAVASGGNQGIFAGGTTGSAQNDADDQQADEEIEQLIEVIRSTIAPSKWAVRGEAREGHTISSFGRSLVVRATAEVHEEIAGYLEIE
jgi:hypothetical protein